MGEQTITSLDATSRKRAGFREDINGLRAFAVCAVTLYHFHVPPFVGGYLGVDIFYVISGFLMTRIIVGGLDADAFSVASFYAARARRIVPALAVLCLAIGLAAPLLLDPWTGQKLGLDAAASMTFWSNMLYASRGGYFGAPQEANWLLHTWSLSVEWQFYLLYPLAVAVVWKLRPGRRWLVVALALAATASFGLALAASTSGATATWGFYLLPFRMWEMCVGGLCAVSGGLSLSERLGRMVQTLGLLGLAAVCCLIRSDAPLQPAWIALAVGATAAVILTNIASPWWARSAVVGRLGLWSYSIYLWHWPVVAALHYWRAPLNPAVIVLSIAASVALGAASYALVERRLTNVLLPPGRRVGWAVLIAGFALSLGVGSAVAANRGFESERSRRLPASARGVMADARVAVGDWRFPQVCQSSDRLAARLDVCVMGDAAARDTLVIGDSHMQQIAPRYARAYGPGRGVTFVTRRGCLPVPGIDVRIPGAGCDEWIRAAYRYAEAAGYRRVVIGSIWFGYLEPEPDSPVGKLCFVEGWRCRYSTDPARYGVQVKAAMAALPQEIARLRRAGSEVVILGPFPVFEAADPMQRYRAAFAGRAQLTSYGDAAALGLRADAMRSLLRDIARQGGARYFEPADFLCGGGRCPLAIDGRGMFKDEAHYRPWVVTSDAFAFLDPILNRGDGP